MDGLCGILAKSFAPLLARLQTTGKPHDGRGRGRPARHRRSAAAHFHRPRTRRWLPRRSPVTCRLDHINGQNGRPARNMAVVVDTTEELV